MFRFFRITSVFIVTLIALAGKEFNFKFGRQGILIIFILLSVNIVVEILDHRRKKKDDIEREKQFQDLKYQLSKPILPFNLRSVLKYTTQESSIQYAFGNQIKSFQGIIDRFKHAGKFIHPDLIDFPWDENHQVNEYILCRLDKNELTNLINADNEHKAHLIKAPFAVELVFYKKIKNGYNEKPDLRLVPGIHFKQQPYTISDLRLYNKNVYLEIFIHEWTIEENTDQLISIYDLRGAKMKLRINLLSYDESDFEVSPYFTLIQFKCGSRPFNIFQLDFKMLGKPTIKKNEGIVLKNGANKLLGDNLAMCYEVILPDKELEKHIKQFN